MSTARKRACMKINRNLNLRCNFEIHVITSLYCATQSEMFELEHTVWQDKYLILWKNQKSGFSNHWTNKNFSQWPPNQLSQQALCECATVAWASLELIWRKNCLTTTGCNHYKDSCASSVSTFRKIAIVKSTTTGYIYIHVYRVSAND